MEITIDIFKLKEGRKIRNQQIRTIKRQRDKVSMSLGPPTIIICTYDNSYPNFSTPPLRYHILTIMKLKRKHNKFHYPLWGDHQIPVTHYGGITESNFQGSKRPDL